MATDPNFEPLVGLKAEPGDDPGVLSSKAARCRRLAAGISDPQAAEVLTNMAVNYEEAADRLTPKG